MSYRHIPIYDDYEIAEEYPYQVRSISSGHVVKEHVAKNGYDRLNLNVDGKQIRMYKHRLVAFTSIYNPDQAHLTDVDHINHDRTDNHIDNLRWTDKATNNANRSSVRGVRYEFVSELPHGCCYVDNAYVIENVYYHAESNTFYKKVADHVFKIMYQRSASSGSSFVKTISFNHHTQVNIYANVVARDIDTYLTVDDNGDVIEQCVDMLATDDNDDD